MLNKKHRKIAKKLSEKREINLLYTNFRKEIKKVQQKLQVCVSLQHYFTQNYLFELHQNAKKEEEKLLNWLNKLIKGQKEYFLLL